MINKKESKLYENTLVLDMFDLVKFEKFDIEKSECCWEEDVIIYRNKEWEQSSILDMVWVIPLKWFLSDLDYNYIENFFNDKKVNLDNYKKYLTDDNIKKYINTIIFIKDKLFILKWKWVKKWTIKIESLDKIINNIEIPYIPLKWIIDKEDYDKLEYWFNINSTIPERILERWDLLYKKEENWNIVIFNYKKRIKFNKEDLDSIIWDILWEWYYNDKIYNKKIEIKLEINEFEKNISLKQIKKEIEKLKKEKDIKNINLIIKN